MINYNFFLAISLSIINFFIGLGIGYYITPQYQLSMYDKNTMNLGNADKWLDLRYMNQMIAHHEEAMLLAKQAQKSQRQEIINLTNDILKNEPPAIEELYQWKKEWYQETKKVSTPKINILGNYDEKFDLRFLNSLIYHHQKGLEMVKEIQQKSSRSEIINNAYDLELFFNNTLEIFKKWRSDWYKI